MTVCEHMAIYKAVFVSLAMYVAVYEWQHVCLGLYVR